MSDASNENGINGTNSSSQITLEELLNDDSFGADAATALAKNDDKHNYYKCLTMFVEGDCEKCLQQMEDLGWLHQTALRNNPYLFNLFLGAFEGTVNLSNLGSSVQESIQKILVGDITCFYANTANLFNKSNISFVTQYYKCCVKLYCTDTANFGHCIEYLKSKVRKAIFSFSSELHNTPDHHLLIGLQQLVEIYLFGIEISLQRLNSSTSSYYKLCEDVPKLATSFRETIEPHSGISLERLVLDRLKVKQQPKTSNARNHHQLYNGHRRHSSNVTSVSPKPYKISPSGEPDSKVGHATELLQKNHIQMITNYIRRWCRYFRNDHLSFQTALIVLILLLISNRNLRKLTNLPTGFSRVYRRVIPHVANLFRLLSSI